MDIKKIATSLANRYGTNNPFDIAKARGVNILYTPLKNTLGYYIRYRRVQNIIIKADLDESLVTFVCAHELGHSILHSNINVPRLRADTFGLDKGIEREANRFAVELLMSDDSLHENPDYSIYDVAAMCGVPRAFAMLKERS